MPAISYRTFVFSPFGGYLPEAHNITPSFLSEERWSFRSLFSKPARR